MCRGKRGMLRDSGRNKASRHPAQPRFVAFGRALAYPMTALKGKQGERSMRIIRVEHGGTSYYGILEDGLVFRLHQQPGHMEPIPLSEAKVLPLVTP